MWAVRVGLSVLVGICAVNIDGHVSGAQAPNTAITYDDFMRLDARQRRERFQTMTPENKSMVVRMHAQRWLEENHDRLSADQIALMNAAIEFVSPALYGNPNDPEQLEKEEALRARLRCRMRTWDVMNAFGVLRSPEPVRNLSWFDHLWDWFAACVSG
jgi:hypothetical protein